MSTGDKPSFSKRIQGNTNERPMTPKPDAPCPAQRPHAETGATHYCIICNAWFNFYGAMRHREATGHAHWTTVGSLPLPAIDNRAKAFAIAQAWIHGSHEGVDPVEWLTARIEAALDEKDGNPKAPRSAKS